MTVPARRDERRSAAARVRVLELCWVWSGPLLGQLLADLGAEVIKVEWFKRFDVYRTRGVERLAGKVPEEVTAILPTADGQHLCADWRGRVGEERFGALREVVAASPAPLALAALDAAGVRAVPVIERPAEFGAAHAVSPAPLAILVAATRSRPRAGRAAARPRSSCGTTRSTGRAWAIWWRATVTGKSLARAHSLVELDVAATNQAGALSARGTAAVVLPSRDRGPVRWPIGDAA